VTERALVTGACGFVGSHLVEHLADRGWDVVATDLEESERDRYYADEAAGEGAETPEHRYNDESLDGAGVEFVPADVTERKTLEPLFERHYDVVFHTASLFDYFADWETLRSVNVDGGRNVGELAAAGDVDHFVHWSTLGVCGGSDAERDRPIREDAPYDPHNRYERSKVEQEQALVELHERAGLPLTVLRPAPVYGPRHGYGVYHLLYLYRKVGTAFVFPIYPRRRQLRFPCVHVDDLVGAALFTHARRDHTLGEVYHVTGDPIRQDELVEFVAEALNLPKRRIPLPWPLYRAVAGWLVPVAGLLERRARARDLVAKIPASMVQYLTSDFWFSNEKIKRAGFEFAYEDPRRGLWEYVTWCKGRGLL